MRLAARASVALCGDGVYRQAGGSDAPFNRMRLSARTARAMLCRAYLADQNGAFGDVVASSLYDAYQSGLLRVAPHD